MIEEYAERCREAELRDREESPLTMAELRTVESFQAFDVHVLHRKGALREVLASMPWVSFKWPGLEPISKSLEEDDEASELHEAEEVLRIELPADKDAALPLNPGEEPFDQPAPGISAKAAAILRSALAAI